MPEMKRTFQSGKMNRDNDDRIVRPGEYREALNVGIGRSESSDIGAIENILGNQQISSSDYIGGEVIGYFRDNGNERIYFFVTDNDDEFELNPDGAQHAVYEYDQGNGLIKTLVNSHDLNFHQNYLITGINFVDDLLFWTDDRNEPRKINVPRARSNADFYKTDDQMALIKFSPTSAPRITAIDSVGNSSFLEDKLVRFAYRFKFNDGEFSTISPLTPIAFLNADGIASFSSDDFLAGQISSFVNQARRVFLEVDIPAGFGITAVEILYNESSSSNIYILEDIAVDGDNNSTIEYTYESQDPFRALPPSQLTRVYDAVPRKAKSQEVAGGRIVFGNYLQNYNLPSVSFEVSAQTKALDSSDPLNRQSVKSRRTYQVGLVLADRYGRQSPVILSSTGNDTLFVDPLTGINAMQQLHVTINTDLPDWVHSFRVVVKQRQQEYYNWFYSGGTGTEFNLTGNNINKIPRDATQETILIGSYAISQSDRKVYPKLNGALNETGTSALQVSQIIYDASGGPTAPAATVYNTGLTSATGVMETSPVESQLDIFYETSTALLKEGTDFSQSIPVDFFNCYIFNVGLGAHLELNRIRAGFNEPWWTVGLKAYAVQENFAEIRRFNTLIHSSGFFNGRVGINQLNQFNEAEGGLTVSLDPADGSVQKLYAEDTQLIIWQEDKVSRSPIDKDFIYSAEGGAVPVTSSTQYLGTIAPFAGEYGISQNPESFAVYGTRKYFSDKNRGVVLRLSNNGLTEISEKGMSDFFRDALYSADKVVGSFDEYHDQYNITISTPRVGSYTGFEDTNVATSSDGYFTVSFEEEVDGWPSFKSFRQQGGTTLNNRYYTFGNGRLWEHNIGDRYNYFYEEDHPSYVEVILNDAPSDVKEFKTVNYEGDAGWICDTVETDTDELTIDPGSRDEAEVFTVSLNITEEVNDGRVLGLQTLTVLPDEQYYWVIKVIPTSSSFIFNNTDNVEVFWDDDTVALTDSSTNEFDGSVFYRTPTQIASRDAIHNIRIIGAAVQDISGAILTITLIDGVNEDEITVSIPPDATFRAGLASYAFVSGAEFTEVEADIDLDSEVYELGPDSVEFVFSQSLLSPFNVPNNDLTETIVGDTATLIQTVNLPDTQTSGSVTVQQQDGKDILRLKPSVELDSISATGDITNFDIYYLTDSDTIERLSTPISYGQFNSGTQVPFNDVFIIPNFTDGGDSADSGFIILNDSDITLSGIVNIDQDSLSFERITDTEGLPEWEGDANGLIGSYRVNGMSSVLEMSENRTDTSKDITMDFNVSVTTTPVDQWLAEYYVHDNFDTPINFATGWEADMGSEDVVGWINTQDFKDAKWYIGDSEGLVEDGEGEIYFYHAQSLDDDNNPVVDDTDPQVRRVSDLNDVSTGQNFEYDADPSAVNWYYFKVNANGGDPLITGEWQITILPQATSPELYRGDVFSPIVIPLEIKDPA